MEPAEQTTDSLHWRPNCAGLRSAKWRFGVSLHGSNPDPLMSALGQKQTLQHVRAMSALPPKANMDQQGWDVCFVPKADIQAAFGYYCWWARVLKFVEHLP